MRLTLDEGEELVAKEALPNLSLIVLLASCRNFGLPKPDALLKVLHDGAFALAGRALDGRERVVVKKPARVDDAADSKAGAPDHTGHEVDVEHDPDAAGAAPSEVELPPEEKLLKVGELSDDLADDVAAVESEVARVGGGLGGGRASDGVAGPRVTGAVGDKDVVGVGEVRIFRRIGRKDSADGLDRRPSVRRHPMMLAASTFGTTQVVVTYPATFKRKIYLCKAMSLEQELKRTSYQIGSNITHIISNYLCLVVWSNVFYQELVTFQFFSIHKLKRYQSQKNLVWCYQTGSIQDQAW